MKFVGIFLIMIAIAAISGCTTNAPNQVSTPSSGKSANQSPSPCIPDWMCGEWSNCTSINATAGFQTRSCVDSSNCTGNESKPSESQLCSLPKSTKEPSDMILQLSDFPSDHNWTLKTRFELAKSDVSQDSISLGWIKGYQVQYYRIGSLNDITSIVQWISIYPLDNITQILEIGICRDIFRNLSVKYRDNITYDEFSNPKIGDDAIACRLRWANNDGREQSEYVIEFKKMDVYMGFGMKGQTLDYDLLKDLARKAEAKIA